MSEEIRNIILDLTSQVHKAMAKKLSEYPNYMYPKEHIIYKTHVLITDEVQVEITAYGFLRGAMDTFKRLHGYYVSAIESHKHRNDTYFTSVSVRDFHTCGLM